MKMRLFGKTTPRQKEIRRSKVERRPVWYRRASERLNLRAVTGLLVAALATTVIVNLGGEVLNLREGERLERAMTARVTFKLIDQQRTQEMKRRARDNAEIYYTLDTTLLEDINSRLTNALRIAREQADQPDQLREQAAAIKLQLDDTALAELIRIANEDDTTRFQQAVDRVVQTLHRQPLVEAEGVANRRTGQKAVLLDPEHGTERSVSILKLLSANDRENVTTVARAATEEFRPPLRESMALSLVDILSGAGADDFKPLYRYDAARSAQAAQAAEEAVPTQFEEYRAGTPLADAGPLTDDELDLLRKEHEFYLAWLEHDPEAAAAHRWAAYSRGVLCFMIVFGLGGYIVVHYAHTLGNLRRRVATVVTLLGVTLLARLAYLDGPTTHLAVGAQALAVMLLAITAVRGVAYVTSGLLALVIALATRENVGFVLILIGVSLVILFSLRDVRVRGRIISIGGVAAVVAAFASALTGLVEGQGLWYVIQVDALWAGLSTLVAAFLVEGILPTIERVFDVTTSMTLLEWCDPNKPLLRMLAAEAPGTYNHALLVGTLADAAADSIAANGLLARTGAYYHDIGKVNKPGYFVENQAMDVGNRHERLSPAMSHLIIIGHVKDGIEMAKEYGLPARLHPFIPEHHGTCVVEYFYHAANQARKPGDREISETEFRYPGPKPQTRETAIVMLCDGVEGAVRAMPEPTPGRIRDTVDRVIQKRLIDGQFDECDLTFRELDHIRESLVKSLNSIYHGRITYPSEEKQPQQHPKTAS